MTPTSEHTEAPAPVLGPSPRQIQAGLRWNIIAGMLAMVWLTLPGTPLTMLMECLDANAFWIGFMVSIQQFAMVLQIPGALLSGLFRQRKGIWAVLSMVHRVVWFAPILLVISPRFTGVNGVRLVLIMVAVSSIFAQLSVSTWHAWMADLIPENQRSRFWGTRQSLLWLVYTPSLLLFGYLLDLFPDPRQPDGHFFGFALVFTLGALAGCLDIVAHLRVPEPPPVLSAIRQRLRDRIIKPFRNRDFSYLTLGMMVWYFNLGLVGSFSILFLTRKFGFSYSQLAILTLSSSLAVIVGGLLWGYFIKRTGTRSFLVSMIMVVPIFAFIWFLLRNTTVEISLPWLGRVSVAQPMVVLSVTNFLASLFYCGIGLCQLNMLSVLTPREDRSMAMAVHWTVIGLGSSLGPLLGGRLVDWFEGRFPMPVYPDGFQFGFMHLLALIHIIVAWGIALPLVLRLRSAAGELPVGATLSRMIVGNPLRLVGNIFMMDTATTSRGRMRAVRGLGRQRVALAVSDLAEQLRNPTSTVREAAADALARIGNREAVEALVMALGQSESTGLTLPVLRALRRIGDPAALPAVLPWLDHTTPEIANAAARTLGAFGDHRAVTPLIEKLTSTPHAFVAATCAEALERIGNPSATRPVLLRLPSIADPVLQPTMAIAAANLFGQRDTFYRLLENEGRHPGTLLDTLMDDVGTTTRGLSRKGWLPANDMLRLIQSLRRQVAAGDAAMVLTRLGEITRLAGSALYRITPSDDIDAWEQAIAAQNERFGILLTFLGVLTAAGTDPADLSQAEFSSGTSAAPSPEIGVHPIGIPLALHLLATLLQEEKGKRR